MTKTHKNSKEHLMKSYVKNVHKPSHHDTMILVIGHSLMQREIPRYRGSAGRLVDAGPSMLLKDRVSDNLVSEDHMSDVRQIHISNTDSVRIIFH